MSPSLTTLIEREQSLKQPHVAPQIYVQGHFDSSTILKII
ncbi:hypothetical protein XBKB1_1900003 [Xenorhabdus bovienii str. kraussei Becker Underwood]|uniref:Uncharacterized protein n=1 Tax=Xenorhabdus bovienii str. kraussei Becker Underwood TaxID=1398204 RepID=A0A077PS98_XENBV|nr:hypothetical protein XBKB1_1900003 [Xenorhabdus bovienii str. kraussei Becker Underwood]